MTPSPTPTPTTDACFYRDAEFKSETVHVLVDAFGRMLVQDDVTDILGMAWNENGVAPDFETNGDYAAQFNAIRTAFGESDVITDITDNTVTFTDTEGNSVLLSFDNEEKTFVPTVSELANGTPNMFKRTLNVNDSDVTFVCDADGKVCWFNNNGNFLLVVNDDEITPTVDAALMTSLVTATGGSTEITNEQSSDDNYNKYTLDDFSFVTDAHGGVTFGAVDELFAFEDLDGKIIIPEGFDTISGQTVFDGETYELNDIPVLVDKAGNNYYLKCGRTNAHMYNSYFIANIPGYESAIPDVISSSYNSSIVGATNSNSAYLSYDIPDKHWTWLFAHGLNPLIMQTRD